MTDRQTKAVAEAIHDSECVADFAYRDGHIQEHYIATAQAAIAASDAKLVPALVDVLRECLHHAMGAGANWELTHQYPHKASDMDWICRKVRDALALLPEEHRQ
jgi:hypothetical protein